MPAIPKDLKAALLNMPSAKKDKLLLQLLAPNQLLQDQLRFELLEGGEEGLEARRTLLEQQITQLTQSFYYTAQELLTALRQFCPAIGYHQKVTQDLYGEVNLWLLLVNGVLEHQQETLQALSGANEALVLFLTKRADEALQKLRKLHPDLHLEFAEHLHLMLTRLHASATGYAARKAGLPAGWDG